MGFKQSDLVPISSAGPSALTPVAKDPVCKVFQVSRTDTSATLKAVLPANSSIIGITYYPSTASDAGDSATVSFTIANASGTISSGSVDVKGTTTIAEVSNLTSLPNIEALPAQGDITVKATYAEAGTASSTGGPWKFIVRYVR